MDLNKIIFKENFSLLKNNRVISSTKQAWGRIVAISNQYIQQKLIKYFAPELKLIDEKEKLLLEQIGLSNKNNSSGFDFVIINENDKIFRIQSKLRQVDGKTPFSKQLDLETTRRNSIKNVNKNQSGHIAYSSNEFDYLLITIIWLKIPNCTRKDIITDVNKWKFVLIPTKDLLSNDKNKLEIKISSSVLNKRKINIKKIKLYF